VGGVIRSVVPVDGDGPVVALSFDDGPDPTWTPQVLDILHGLGIRAAFCLVGRSARAHPALVRAIRDAGHVLCDHSENHPLHLDRRPPQDIEHEVGDAAANIAVAAGVRPVYFRPPGGAFAPVITDVSHHNGMRVLGWAIDPRDWKAKSPDDVVGYIMAGIRPGEIVLLHDGGGNRGATVAALLPLVHALADRGYRFTTP
jgi:peptidoglycan/xylan/chitin deacetylase (PgdA/CDA1 family)